MCLAYWLAVSIRVERSHIDVCVEIERPPVVLYDKETNKEKAAGLVVYRE